MGRVQRRIQRSKGYITIRTTGQDAETMSIGHHKVLIIMLKVINSIVLKHGGSDWPQPFSNWSEHVRKVARESVKVAIYTFMRHQRVPEQTEQTSDESSFNQLRSPATLI